MAFATTSMLRATPFVGNRAPLAARPAARPTAPRRVVVAAAEPTTAAAAPAVFTPPVLDPNTPSPIFGGSTGGLLRKAQVRWVVLGATGRNALGSAGAARPRCRARRGPVSLHAGALAGAALYRLDGRYTARCAPGACASTRCCGGLLAPYRASTAAPRAAPPARSPRPPGPSASGRGERLAERLPGPLRRRAVAGLSSRVRTDSLGRPRSRSSTSSPGPRRRSRSSRCRCVSLRGSRASRRGAAQTAKL